MEISFNNQELADLFEGIKPKRKEWKSNAQMVKQFVNTVVKLRSVEKVEELMQFGGLHYKKLTDDPNGMCAVRINQQYRLHFKEVENDLDPPQVVLFEIEKITNHYQ